MSEDLVHLTAELNMHSPFPDAPDICPGIIASGHLFPVTTKVKKTAYVKVWTVPRNQLAWAIRHIEKNHSVRLAASKGRIAVIEINMGTDAHKQFKLLGGGRFHSNFRWTKFFFLRLRTNHCDRRLYYSDDPVRVTEDMWSILDVNAK